jgi:hypothetical protein
MKLLLPPMLLLLGLAGLGFHLAGWLGLGAVGLLLAWLLRKALQRAQRMRREGHVSHYQTGNDALNSALALCHPMAFHCVLGGVADAELLPPDDDLAKQLRPMLLHHLGLRTDLEEAQIHRQFPQQLRQRWFQLDLQTPHPHDDARAAMALACARVAFFVRCAHMMGWLPQDLQQEVLLLNARRARDCFGSWLEYGHAYAQGRQQWLAHGRSDILGVAFSPADVAQWVQSATHPWHALAWQPSSTSVAPSTTSPQA